MTFLRLSVQLLVLALSLPGASSAWAQSSAELFAVTLIDLQERPAELKKWQGKPLIVNFWARWCGPCRREIPDLIQFRKDYGSKGIEVLGIALEDKAEPVRDFAQAYEMDYPILLAQDKGFALMKALGNTKMGLPFTVAIDRQGAVTMVKMGVITQKELAQAVETLLR